MCISDWMSQNRIQINRMVRLTIRIPVHDKNTLLLISSTSWLTIRIPQEKCPPQDPSKVTIIWPSLSSWWLRWWSLLPTNCVTNKIILIKGISSTRTILYTTIRTRIRRIRRIRRLMRAIKKIRMVETIKIRKFQTALSQSRRTQKRRIKRRIKRRTQFQMVSFQQLI